MNLKIGKFTIRNGYIIFKQFNLDNEKGRGKSIDNSVNNVIYNNSFYFRLIVIII